MRLIFIYILLSLFVNTVSSQGENDYVGINSEFSVNLFDKNNNNLWTIRPNLTFNKQKMQYTIGPVISEIYVDGGWNEDYKIKAFTGLAFTVKRYLNTNKKNRAYYFANVMYLKYRSSESPGSRYGSTPFQLTPDEDRNRIRVFQPIVGSGVEYRWFNAITFSLDFGFGWCFRKIEYENNYNDYPTKISSFIGQFKLGLGYYF